ncbi:TetR/AcrR family transcriptional regulator [Nocardioides sp. BP30]|uniref:TetR/AcrR family transcriptional regulator n=1 Tax=Nocardioides sp. BP30 TaxID=3036374 RepID=UPI002469B5E6|nr:TetR/AcrR family transcriptional regulator [Nocardioides sp. BP30]WGL53292.1 TetR/AcrR family transcriptional regulator [Nocardioides sp. BP30]
MPQEAARVNTRIGLEAGAMGEPTQGAGRGDLTRARLLDAAVQVFGEKGFHGTTTRDIAAAAGMSPAAVYVHHRSKEELLHVISREGHRTTLELVRRAGATGPPTQRLASIARDFGRHHAQGHTWARIVNYELEALSPEHREEIRALRIAIEHEVRSVIEDGMASGEFDVPDVGMATTAVLSLGIDIARWYRDDGRWTAGDVGDQMAVLALRIVGGRAT